MSNARLAVLFGLAAALLGFALVYTVAWAADPGTAASAADNLLHVPRNWSTVGTLGGIGGATIAALAVLRATPAWAWLDARGWGPLAACAVGAVVSCALAAADPDAASLGDVRWVQAVVAGLGAGFAAAGAVRAAKELVNAPALPPTNSLPR